MHTLTKIDRHDASKRTKFFFTKSTRSPSIFLLLAEEDEIFVGINGLNKRAVSPRRGESFEELTLLNSEAQETTTTVQSTGGMERFELDKTALTSALQNDPSLAERFSSA